MISVLGYFSGQGAWAQLLTFIFFVLAGLALFARPGPRPTSVLVELVPQPSARFVGLLLVGTLIAAVVVGALTGAAFDQRYIAVVFPLFVILCALGLTTFGSRTVTAGVLAVACVAGLMSARQWDSQPRTEAVKVAADLNQEAQAGDVVVYCPDQLGPAVDRLLTVPGVTELTYPRMLGAQRVDWVNYLFCYPGTSTQTFAHEVVGKLDPGNRLWLVWRNGYLGFGGSCGNLASWLDVYLPGGLTVLGGRSPITSTRTSLSTRADPLSVRAEIAAAPGPVWPLHSYWARMGRSAWPAALTGLAHLPGVSLCLRQNQYCPERLYGGR